MLFVIIATVAECNLGGVWNLEGLDKTFNPVRCSIAVPGDIQTALRAHGKMPDPFWGSNETNVQWVGRREWTLTRTFDLSEEFLSHDGVILRLEDCDTFATVYINGREIGSAGEFSDNSFTLLPGRPKTLTFEAKDPKAPLERSVESLSVQSLSDAD